MSMTPRRDRLAPSLPRAQTGCRELAARTFAEFEIRLLWNPPDDRLVVVVHDALGDERFEIPVRAGQRPLDVFYHPFGCARGGSGSDEARLSQRAPTPSTPIRAESSVLTLGCPWWCHGW